jgi:chaperone modulatory protein CbpM
VTDSRDPASHVVEAALDDARLTLDELCRAVAVDAGWVVRRIEAGLIAAPADGAPQSWHFDAVALTRVRRMVRIERDFDAVPELAALVADLAEEVVALRCALRRSRGG